MDWANSSESVQFVVYFLEILVLAILHIGPPKSREYENIFKLLSIFRVQILLEKYFLFMSNKQAFLVIFKYFYLLSFRI